MLSPSHQAADYIRRSKTDELFYLQSYVRIVDEDSHLVPFRVANRPMQQHFVEKVLVPKAPKVIELKARRVGGTSIFTGIGFARTQLRPHYSVLLLAQSDMDSKAFMKGTFQAYWRDMVPEVQLPDGQILTTRVALAGDTWSEHEVRFVNGSKIVVATAGSIKFGRGQAFDMIIGTEVARWDVGRPPGTAEETWSMAVGAAGDKPELLVIQESTAYGAAGYFYEMYQAAKRRENGYLALFYDWRWHPRYRYAEGHPQALSADQGDIKLTDVEVGLGLDKEQARWRRATMADFKDLFWQEYPEDDETCLVADTRVGTEYGIIKIADIKPSTATTTGCIVASGQTGIRNVYELETRWGFVLQGTADHKIKTTDGFVPLRNCVDRKVELSVPMFSLKQATVSWSNLGVACSVQVDESWGEFLGVFMGDGCYGGTTLEICFDNRDIDLLERELEVVSGLFGKRPAVRQQGNSSSLRLQNKHLTRIFEELDIIGPGPKRVVKVPECIWKSPRPVVASFLAGLFEADGWVSETGSCVRFFTKYEQFAKDVQVLLLGFGIKAKRTQVTKKAYGGVFTGYELRIPANQVPLFMQIGFLSERKRMRLCEWYNHRHWNKEHTLTDMVATIKPIGLRPVYDLTIDKTHMFDANGIAVHNCFRMSGDPYFDIDVVDRNITMCRPLLSTSESGHLKIWQAPRVGERYIVAVDPGGRATARGTQHMPRDEAGEPTQASHERDYDAVGVFDSRLTHVATLHGRWDKQTLGKLIVDLCCYYNNAMCICESGPYGDPVLLVLGTVLGYKNLYYERDEHGKPKVVGKLVGPASKPGLLDNFKTVVEQGVFRSDDKMLWGEMRNYHRMPTKSGTIKLEARAGHDDLVMMAALAAWAWQEGNFGRPRQQATRVLLSSHAKKPSPSTLGKVKAIGEQKVDILKKLEVQVGNSK